MSSDKPLTVSELTAQIDRAIRSGVPASVTVRGEVSNVSARSGSGHLYFTLKDSGACLGCVMWRTEASRLAFKPEDGMELIAAGRITLYAPQGKYQLQAQRLTPVGQGALEVAFRQLQAKLLAEGLFAPERKKPIPRFPRRIAIVTSRDTAALQDILKVLRRFPWLSLLVYHVPVQGEGSAPKIAAALKHLSDQREKIGAEIILLARGGGSLEDLWSFNEEIVARAVAASKIPIVTGIGHEIDCTIADLVADYHAHTPTEAAQVVSQYWKQAAEQLSMGTTRLRRALGQVARESRQRLNAIERHEVFRRPMDRIQVLRQLLDDRQKSALLALASLVRLKNERVSALSGRLEALSPTGVLGRGYSITTLKKSGAIVRAASEIKTGDRLLTRFADGRAESLVQDSRQLPLFE